MTEKKPIILALKQQWKLLAANGKPSFSAICVTALCAVANFGEQFQPLRKKNANPATAGIRG